MGAAKTERVAVIIDGQRGFTARFADAMARRGWSVSVGSQELADRFEAQPTRVDLVVVASDGADWLTTAEIASRARSVWGDRPLLVLALDNAPAEHAEMLLDAGYDDWIVDPGDAGALSARLAVIDRQILGRSAGQRMTAELSASATAFDELAERVPCGVYESTPSGRFLRVNQGMVELLGYMNKDELLAVDIPKDLYRDAGEREQLLATIDAHDIAPGNELHFRRKDGSDVVLLDHAFARRDSAGGVVSYVGTLTDITDRVRALGQVTSQAANLQATVERRTAEFKQTEAMYRAAIEAVPVGVVIADVQPRARRLVNSAMAEIVGRPSGGSLLDVPAGAMTGDLRVSTVAGDDVMEEDLPTNRALRSGEVVRNEEFVVERTDGTRRVLLVSAAPIRNADREITAAVTVATDITVTRELEVRVRRAEALEAMGRFAGAVAHDFGNLIMVVLGAAHLLGQRYAADSEAHGELEMITRSARSAADLSRSLLAISRQQMLRREVLSVDAVVEATLPLIGRMMGDRVELRHVRSTADAAILADQASVERILVNLCLNARDAMAEGGYIEIECGRVDVDDEAARIQTWMRAGTFVRLTVRDTGSGMDQTTLDSVLDPFFTTKDPERGTGLGLTSVYGAAKQHGGFITIVSEPGVGTEVSVYLPCADGEIAPQTKSVVSRHMEQLRVLVVEDREDLLEIMCRVLDSFGHTITAAANGREALDLLEACNGSIDVVVSDVVMPVMGGFELRDRCRERWPRIGFVLCSGNRGSIRDLDDSDELTVVLEKPFDVDDLEHRISSLMASVRRAAKPSLE
jgi:PAS domain S-box-containing protein